MWKREILLLTSGRESRGQRPLLKPTLSPTKIAKCVAGPQEKAATEEAVSLNGNERTSVLGRSVDGHFERGPDPGAVLFCLLNKTGSN